MLSLCYDIFSYSLQQKLCPQRTSLGDTYMDCMALKNNVLINLKRETGQTQALSSLGEAEGYKRMLVAFCGRQDAMLEIYHSFLDF